MVYLASGAQVRHTRTHGWWVFRVTRFWWTVRFFKPTKWNTDHSLALTFSFATFAAIVGVSNLIAPVELSVYPWAPRILDTFGFLVLLVVVSLPAIPAWFCYRFLARGTNDPRYRYGNDGEDSKLFWQTIVLFTGLGLVAYFAMYVFKLKWEITAALWYFIIAVFQVRNAIKFSRYNLSCEELDRVKRQIWEEDVRERVQQSELLKQRDKERKEAEAKTEIAGRPAVSAAAMRDIMAAYAKHIILLKDVMPLEVYRERMQSRLGTAKHSATIQRNLATEIDKLEKAAIRERVRQEYLSRQPVIGDRYSLTTFQADVGIHLDDALPLSSFSTAADAMLATIEELRKGLQPEFDRLQAEKIEQERKRREHAEQLAAQNKYNERLAKKRLEIREAVMREFSGLPDEQIEQEIDQQLSRWKSQDAGTTI